MSESDDSVKVPLQNGDHVTNGLEEEEEESKSNGIIETSIDQELEPEPEIEPKVEESEHIHNAESKEDMFVDATDDMQDNLEMDNGSTRDDSAEKDNVLNEFKEEREEFVREVANLRSQLRSLANNKQSLHGDDNDVQEEMAGGGGASLTEMINECSQFVNVFTEERLQYENTINELRQQIEDLNGTVQVEQNVEIVVDRMLGSLSIVINQEELLDYSVMGKIAHAERNASLLVDQYRWFLYELDQLRHCLLEGGFYVGVQEEFGYELVFATARGGLLELKKREAEMVERVSHLEYLNKKFVEEVEKERAQVEIANSELEKVKVELDQEKTRCANTKEKLSMAVTKGKALVQQRDSLKQSLAEKTSELDKCLVELQEKSSATEAAELCRGELSKCENLIASLQQTLSQRSAILESLEGVFSQISVPEELQPMDITERLKWLVNMVASLQETLSQKNVILENFEAIFSQTSVIEGIESMDMVEKLKWLVNLVASLQEMLSQRNSVLDSLEEIFSQISAPAEVQSMGTVETFKWIVEERNALKDNLLEFHKLKDALSLIDLPETAPSCDLESRIGWLKQSVIQAKSEINMLQDEIARIKEAAHNEIDSLSTALLAESQEKEYIKQELDDLACKFEGVTKEAHRASYENDQLVRLLLEGSGITETSSDVAALVQRCFGKIKEQSNASFDTSPAYVDYFERMQNLLYVRDQELMLCEKLLEEDMLVRSEANDLRNELSVASVQLAALKEEKDSLQKDLERSEEKSALLREKLALAVKKGKGLVQDRENLKLALDEKRSEIEKLKLELQQEESTVAEYRDQINRLSTDLDRVPELEANIVAMQNQHDQLEQLLSESSSMLQRVMKSVDCIALPIDRVFEEPIEKVNWLKGYMIECEQAKIHAEEELDKIKEETSVLISELAEAQQTMKSLEDAVSVAENHISQLTEEKREIDVAKQKVEQELQEAKDEAHAQTSKFTEFCAARKSLEDALSLAENNLSLILKEKDEAQLSRAATETELGRMRDEDEVQTGKLTEAYRTIKSLEDKLSQAEASVSLLTEQNNHVEVGRTNLEYELNKLKEDAESQASSLADASLTMRSLEDALSEAGNNISVLEGEKKIAEQEISTLNSKLKACMDELAGTNGNLENRSAEFIHHLDDLQMLLRNESLLPMVTQHFEREFENLKNMDHSLRDIKDHFDTSSEVLQGHPIMEEDWDLTKPFPQDLCNIVNIEMDDGDASAADVDNVYLYFKKTVGKLQLQNTTIVGNFEGFSTFIAEFTEALLRKLRVTEDAITIIFEHMESIKKKMKNMELRKEEQEKTIAFLEKDCRVLLSACTNATSELQFKVKNDLLELSSIPDLEKLNHQMILEVTEVGADDMEEHQQSVDDSRYDKTAENLLMATRKVQTLVELFESASNVAAVAIEDLQNKLQENRVAYEKAIEERGLIQSKVSELESNAEALQNCWEELRLETGDYQAIKEKLKEKEAELSHLHNNLLMKEQEEEDALMSATELKTLFVKIRGVEIPFVESEVHDLGPNSSADVQKLFYIIDSLPALHRQINALSHDKDKLQTTLSMQVHEIEHLKEEIETQIRNNKELEKISSEMSETTSGLEIFFDLLGGSEIVGDRKCFGVQGLLPIVEKQIIGLLLEAENSKSQAQELGTRLLESQKVIDELTAQVKLLEDLSQSKTVKPELVQERSIFEAPSLPTGSEISEIEDAGSVGNNGISHVSSAAQLRTMRKGSADHLVLSIDSEASSLINNEETDEDKGHVFKSLNTSGLIPKQGKSLADQIDGIWVSGGRVLMSRPRARLGFIAYWLFLHIWLLGTIL